MEYFFCSQEILLNDPSYISKCQVDTPVDVVAGLWKIVMQHRSKLGSVVDLGAGDGRFARGGNYATYEGYEIDPTRTRYGKLPHGAKIINQCAFKSPNNSFDLCIGNPPYVRHHDLDPIWRDMIGKEIAQAIGRNVDKRSNAFILFMLKALLSTRENGLVAQIVPFEWVSRPASRFLHEYIKENNWAVTVYRFEEEIFDRVFTTASVSIIDKADKSGAWNYFKINRDFTVSPMSHASGSSKKVIKYSKRSDFGHALRGLSPGGQEVFCLTEGERLFHGLKIGEDVLPCITTMKHLPEHITCLSETTFRKYYIEVGQRCWLISPTANPSSRLSGYLKGIPESARSNYTCAHQTPWWSYRPHPAPQILFSTGFVNKSPKVLVNHVGAVAVGGIAGIHNLLKMDVSSFANHIRTYDFESRVVRFAGKLKKIEIHQMNTIIGDFISKKGT